jgi:hypothetical protein
MVARCNLILFVFKNPMSNLNLEDKAPGRQEAEAPEYQVYFELPQPAGRDGSTSAT